MPEESAPQIDEEQLKRVGNALLDSWSAQSSSKFRAGRRGKGRVWSQHQFVCVHALTAHVHRLYPAAARLLDDGCVVESLPLIRTAFETALTAHWIAQSEDGANAFLNEDVRRRRGLERSARLGLSPEVMADGSVNGIDLEPLETSAAGPARNFEQLCLELTPGGHNAYFHYRALSMYSHPSVALVDEYLTTDETGEFGGLVMAAKDKTSAPWRGLLVASLIWSGRAVDYFDMDHSRRSQLRAAARELGFAGELQLHPKAPRRQTSSGRKSSGARYVAHRQ